MQRIVFLVYHGRGHFNACFRPAKILQAEYEVIFAGVAFFKSYLTVQGFSYYPLRSVPFGKGFETWTNKIAGKKNIYLASLRDRITDRLYHEREKELVAMIDTVKPDILLIDPMQASDFIVLYHYARERGIKIALVQTAIPSTLSSECPPINSLVFPGDKAGIRRSLAWHRLTRTLQSFFSKIKYLGFDNAFIVKRRIKLNKIPSKYFDAPPCVFGTSFNGVPEFILSNREFDFRENPIAAYQHYAGFMTETNRVEITELDYLKTVSEIKTKRLQTKCPLIYCSFGTVKSRQARHARAFVKRLSRVAVTHQYIVIIATQENDFIANDIPGSVYFFKSVPQLEVLSLADVFITHGGINSIKESVHAGVPMLVYLTESHSDQRGCSTRVAFHRLGLRGSLRRDTEEDIHHKISDLVLNPVYKENLEALKRADAQYTPEKFLSLVRSLPVVN